EGDLDAVDAAVALVDQLVVVGNAVGERDAVRGISAGAIHEMRDELLVLRLGRRRQYRSARERRQRHPDMSSNHWHPPVSGRPDPARMAGSTPRLGTNVPANCRALNPSLVEPG